MSRIAARAAAVAGIMLCAGTAFVQAQTDATVSLQLYAGLTVFGWVGSNYTVQCVSSLGQTNSDNNWQTLTNLALPSSPYIWADLSIPATGQRFYRVISSNNIPGSPDASKLTWVAPGMFVMGSPVTEAEREYFGDDETQHTVIISRGFYMGKYLVTQADYQAVMGSNPSHFSGNPNNPVEQVSWNDATNYCAVLTQQQQAAGTIPPGWVYRLPTESEWEYACRAGTTTALYFGNAIREGMANFYSYDEYDSTNGTITTNTAGVGYIGKTTPVGSYRANSLGLYDMCANVWEWCSDWYGAYPIGSVTDPAGASTGSTRVIRGGGWNDYGACCRSAPRYGYTPDVRHSNIGFRLVLAPGQP